ncbi:hypothetical protein MTO96_011336 [Rhipicephalus appendiculatus]
MQHDLDLQGILKQASRSTTGKPRHGLVSLRAITEQTRHAATAEIPGLTVKDAPVAPPVAKTSHKMGHFARVCRSAHETVHAVVQDNSGLDSDGHVFMTSSHCQAVTTSPQVDFKVDGETVRFTIDTGATVCVVSSNSLKNRSGKGALTKTSMKVFAYGANSPLPPLRMLDVVLTYRERTSHEDLRVASGNCTPLLSFSAASRLGLVQITYSLEETANRLDPRVAYPDLFSGVGCLRDLRVHLHVGTPLFNQ